LCDITAGGVAVGSVTLGVAACSTLGTTAGSTLGALSGAITLGGDGVALLDGSVWKPGGAVGVGGVGASVGLDAVAWAKIVASCWRAA
jgi:hypothetical protein